MRRILIAEADRRAAAFLDKGLRAAGFSTATVADADTAVGFALSDEFDLLLLDLGFPGPDGAAVLLALRHARSPLPVIIVSACDDIDAVVAGLNGGAADYLTKPYRFDELLARARLRLFRERGPSSTLLSVDGLSLDLRSRRAVVDGHDVVLTAREYGLLELFLRHRDQVLTRGQIRSRVWGHDDDGGSNIIDVLVRALRVKIGRDRIATVRGVGYRYT